MKKYIAVSKSRKILDVTIEDSANVIVHIKTGARYITISTVFECESDKSHRKMIGFYLNKVFYRIYSESDIENVFEVGYMLQ